MTGLRKVFSALLGCALLAVSCGGEDTSAPPPAQAPVVTGVSRTVVSPGDTLVISGSRFETPASANRVRFANPLAVQTPFAGSSTELSVVVDRDATSGPFTVTSNDVSGQGPALEVQRGVGDVFVYGGLGSSQALALPNPTASTRYLLVPHAVNASAPYTQSHTYVISSASVPPVALAASADAQTPRGSMTIHERFEAWRWEQADELFARAGFPRAVGIAPQAPGEAQQFRQFNVLKTTSGSVLDPASYRRVTAELRYSGSKCLVYADVDTLASGNLAQSDFNQMGQAFDNSIETTNVAYFGGHSDIDNNGKVIILSTPVVNRLTPPSSSGFIAGFFLSIDLYSPPAVPSGTTNQGEILYLLAADPGAFWGNPFPVVFTRQENINTSAHEHEHLISFSHRLLVQRGSAQATWLEEGMAHMAEHLNGIDTANRNRGALYLADPGAVSLEDNSATLEQRGGIYLFLQLMVDRYGADILKGIVQSKCTGRACVESVTGGNFYELAGEFFAALYVTGRGITDDPRFNYASIDLANFGTLKTVSHAAGAPDVTGTIRRTAGDFHIFSGAQNNESRFTFANPGGQATLRHMVVRIQ